MHIEVRNMRIGKDNISYKPLISIFASAHRPRNWMNLYDSIGENDVSFELVFVGPNRPQYPLPNNFRFIESNVKPAQCFEIAYRNSVADLIMPIADDCEFMTQRPLDRLYKCYQASNTSKTMVSCRYCLDGVKQPLDYHRYNTADANSPLMPLAPLMTKKDIQHIGGIDKNFIAVFWDLDVIMRFLAIGGEVVFSDVFLNEDKGRSEGSVLCSEFWQHDRRLLESLWTCDGKILQERSKPVESYSEYRILTHSQGPRGRWRGTNPLIVEMFVDKSKKIATYKAIIGRLCRAIGKPGKYPAYAKRVLSRMAEDNK